MNQDEMIWMIFKKANYCYKQAITLLIRAQHYLEGAKPTRSASLSNTV